MRYNYLLIYKYSTKRLAEISRDLEAALLLLSYLSPSQSKLQVLIQFWCAYDTSHLFLQAFLIACEFNLVLFSFLISLLSSFFALFITHHVAAHVIQDMLVLFIRLHDVFVK